VITLIRIHTVIAIPFHLISCNISYLHPRLGACEVDDLQYQLARQ
jgi:hypothetical protein